MRAGGGLGAHVWVVHAALGATDGGEILTGLELFIVRKLVDRHGGRVWAQSAGPGRGAPFFVALPVG